MIGPMRFFCTGLFTLFLTAHLSAQVSAATLTPDTIPHDPAVRRGRLPNGLRYLLRVNERPENRAELRLVVRAGSLQEDDDQTGVAHFVEHMAFNGTEHFAKNELIDYLERVGTRFGPDLNAYTSFGETVYMLQARTDSIALLEQGLLMLEDWAGGITFDPGEIDKERGVVISEWRSRLSPDQRLQQQYFPVLYQGSRYAERLPIGDPALIDTVSYATVRRYYDDWYRPDLMTVIAVGDFDIDWMERQIIARFGDLRARNAPRPRLTYEVPRHEDTRIVRCTDPEAPFTRIQVVYKHPAHRVRTVDDLRAQLTHSLYNRMLNARLFEYQQRQAAPSFTFAYSGYGGDVGEQDVYYVSAFTAGGKALDGLRAVLRETYRARQHGFAATELERHKAAMLREAEEAALEAGKERSGQLADQLVRYAVEGSPYPDPAQTLRLYRQLLPGITTGDINPLPAAWLTPENRVIVVTGPANDTLPLPSEEALLDLLEETAGARYEPYIDDVSDDPLLAEAPQGGCIVSEKRHDELDVTELQLDNGVRIVLKPTDFQNEEILMNSFSPGGHSLYSDEDYQSASTAATLINLSGVGAFPLPELEKKLAGREVSVGPYITELYEGISARCAPRDLETMLQLTYLYVTAPRRDSVALASYLARQRSIVERMFINPYYYFAEARNQIKYRNHPRRRMTKMEDLEAISLDRAYDVYRERFADAGDFTFVLVGNFAVDSVRALLSTYLGGLPSNGRRETWRDVGADLAPGHIDSTLVRGQAPKSLVELTFHGDIQFTSQERYDYHAMIEVLRIKLRETMREDQGGVYGVRLSGTINQHPRPEFRTTLSFNADPAETEPLIQAALGEIRRLQAEGASEADLVKVRETQRQERIKSLKENGFWLGQLAARYREDIPLDGIRLEVYEKYIERLNATAIREAANRYFDLGAYIRLVLMPETAEEK